MKSRAKKRVAKAKKSASAPLHPDFEKLVALAPQGIVIYRNFRPLYANKAFARLLGYRSPKEILEMPIMRPLISPDYWARMEHDYGELMNHGEFQASLRLPLLRKNGKETWVGAAQGVVDWYGAPAAQLCVFDITPHVALEQSLLRTEQHMRSVLEFLPYPIYISRNSDGRLVFVNRKTCLTFQRRAGDMLRGTSVDFFVDPQARDDLRKLFGTLDDVREVEAKMKTSSGSEFTAEISAIRMDYDGEPSALVALNDITERKALEAELLQQASTDSLTGIANRRYFMAQAEQELRRARRFERPLSVMMLDVDHFKPINDQHGHAVGDAVLQGIVRRASESLRQLDQIARFGGEEFAIILPETNLAAAVRAGERLRAHLAERPIIAAGKAVPCTVSIGVAELGAGDTSIDDLLRRADEALYRAKEGGRDRVEQA